ncbi:hypothetical protein [Streptomyces rapamycinicus]|uniref:hypothetical protein n=1 Tax=Streptomyces rapamycinicus TaxID=1226757 RepID=UPI0032D8D763
MVTTAPGPACRRALASASWQPRSATTSTAAGSGRTARDLDAAGAPVCSPWRAASRRSASGSELPSRSAGPAPATSARASARFSRAVRAMRPR